MNPVPITVMDEDEKRELEEEVRRKAVAKAKREGSRQFLQSTKMKDSQSETIDLAAADSEKDGKIKLGTEASRSKPYVLLSDSDSDDESRKDPGARNSVAKNTLGYGTGQSTAGEVKDENKYGDPISLFSDSDDESSSDPKEREEKINHSFTSPITSSTGRPGQLTHHQSCSSQISGSNLDRLRQTEEEEEEEDDDDDSSECSDQESVNDSPESESEDEHSFCDLALKQNVEEICREEEYFADLGWDDSAVEAVVSMEEWNKWFPIANRIGLLMKVEKSVQKLITIFLGVCLLSQDNESKELINTESDLFNRFWTPSPAIVTCIMQGGKTRRAIFLRGYFLANVRNLHAVVFSNGESTSYLDMADAVRRLNAEFEEMIPKCLRGRQRGRALEGRNRYIPEKAFLFSRLNETENWGAIWSKHPGTAHFNVRLSGKVNLESLNVSLAKIKAMKGSNAVGATAYQKNLIESSGFNPQNSFLILDESHESQGGTGFASTIRKEVKRWGNNVTFVTATTQSHLYDEVGMQQLKIVPKPGYYIHGIDREDSMKDSDEWHIYVVNHEIVESFSSAPKPKVEFPYTAFAGKDAVDKKYVSKLNQICEQRNSHHQIVLNDFEGYVNTNDKRKSINIGHAMLSLWCAKNAQCWMDMRSEEKMKVPSIASVSVYNFSKLETMFRLPRLYINMPLFSRLRKLKSQSIQEAVLRIIFTTDGKDTSRCFRSPSQLQKIFKSLEAIVESCSSPINEKNASAAEAERVFEHDYGIYSIHLGRGFDIKATLSLIEVLHKLRVVMFPSELESELKIKNRFQQAKVNYNCRPLKIFVFGKTLLKQSVSVESKSRDLQGTGLMYMQNPKAQIDYTRLLQMLGRIDHGLNDGGFYTSAFPPMDGKVNAIKFRRPTLTLREKLQIVVRGMPLAMEKLLFDSADDKDLNEKLQILAEGVDYYDEGPAHKLMGGSYLKDVNNRYREAAQEAGANMLIGKPSKNIDSVRNEVLKSSKGLVKACLKQSDPFSSSDRFEGTQLDYLREWLSITDEGMHTTSAGRDAMKILQGKIQILEGGGGISTKKRKMRVEQDRAQHEAKKRRTKELRRVTILAVLECLADEGQIEALSINAKQWGDLTRRKILTLSHIEFCSKRKEEIARRICDTFEAEDVQQIVVHLQKEFSTLRKTLEKREKR